MPGGVESARAAAGAAAAGAHLVILSSSHYFHNYRHSSNALAVYHAAREAGVSDERIVLMLAGDHACDPRNAVSGGMRHTSGGRLELYPCDARVDYRGDEVNVAAFLRVLTDRLPPGAPASRRLLSDWQSDVVVYMTGHGGDGFFKFRDLEELGAAELAAALAQMQAQRRAARLLVLLDTCQAETMVQLFSAAGLSGAISVAASRRGESSLSRQVDPGLGVAVADRFTFQLHAFLTTGRAAPPLPAGYAAPPPTSAPRPPGSRTLGRLVDALSHARILSTVVVSQHGWGHRPGSAIPASGAGPSILGEWASILGDGRSILGGWAWPPAPSLSAWASSIFGAEDGRPADADASQPPQGGPAKFAAPAPEPKIEDLDLSPFFSAPREDGMVFEHLGRQSHPTPPTGRAPDCPTENADAAAPPPLYWDGACSIPGAAAVPASAAWVASVVGADSSAGTAADLMEWRRASVAALHMTATHGGDEWQPRVGGGVGGSPAHPPDRMGLRAHAADGWSASADGVAVLVGVLVAAPLLALVFGARVWDRREAARPGAGRRSSVCGSEAAAALALAALSSELGLDER